MRTLCFFAVFLITLPIIAQEQVPYQQRRQQLMDKFPETLTLVATTTDEEKANQNFYYLTGLEIDRSVLVVSPLDKKRELLFTDHKVDFAGEIYPRDMFAEIMQEKVQDYEKVNVVNNYHLVFNHPEIFEQVNQISNINETLVYMRIIKDSTEISYLREACRITAEGLKQVFQETELGMTEQDLIDIMTTYFKSLGSAGASFYQAASGPNSVHIHFDATTREIKEGDIIVFDIGAWYNNYTADISRTIPASGQFTKPQKEIYKAVLEAQKVAIEAMKPGARLLDVQKIAEDKLIEGLHKLGLVLDTESEWQRKFFIQHGFYHFIGLYVHDVWYDYRVTLDDKNYQPGMVMTMEPGVYFPENMLNERPSRIKDLVSEKDFESFVRQIKPVYENYAGMGVRIEDDILITETGNQVLTNRVPKEIDEIEALMK